MHKEYMTCEWLYFEIYTVYHNNILMHDFIMFANIKYILWNTDFIDFMVLFRQRQLVHNNITQKISQAFQNYEMSRSNFECKRICSLQCVHLIFWFGATIPCIWYCHHIDIQMHTIYYWDQCYRQEKYTAWCTITGFSSEQHPHWINNLHRPPPVSEHPKSPLALRLKSHTIWYIHKLIQWETEFKRALCGLMGNCALVKWSSTTGGK